MTKNYYSLDSLPQSIKKEFLKNRVLKQAAVESHRDKVSLKGGLFSGGASEGNESMDPVSLTLEEVEETPVVWGTGEEPQTVVGIDELKEILPRVAKTKEEQKHRTKDKAEVFTPAWVVNKQNNLFTVSELEKDAFNTEMEVKENSQIRNYWEPTREPIFQSLEKAVEFITTPALEITCGEAPYLVSPYDAATGETIPIKTEDGRFQRVGLLDRKLRVASEMAETIEEYDLLAKTALKNIYGYEWQGDNLLIARLNLLNSYIEYREKFIEEQELNKEYGQTNTSLSPEELEEIAEIISWNIWQMDGLTMTLPLTCTENCERCDEARLSNSEQAYYGHDGEVAVINFKNQVFPFEDLILCQTFEKQLEPIREKSEESKGDKALKKPTVEENFITIF